MASEIHVLGFAGSLRQESYNKKLLRAAGEMLPEGMRLEIFDLAPIPMYNDDVRLRGYPAPVQDLRDRIAAADAILIATPEYNFSIPGVLKNALDWVSRPPDPPLSGMPGAIMGASQGYFGTAKAQVHLRDVCSACNVFLVNRPEVLVMRAQEKFDEQGNLTDETARVFLRGLLVALAALTRRLRGEVVAG